MLLIAGTQAWADDLNSIYRQALSNEPQFQAARADYLANKEIKSQAWAVLLPQINGTVYKTDSEKEYSNVSGVPGLANGTSSTDSDGYSLNLTQTIYDQGKFSGLSQASAKVAQAVADFNYQQQELILRVAKNYFDVLAAEDNRAFSRAEKKSIAHQLEQTTQRFNVGLTAITDVHEAKADMINP